MPKERGQKVVATNRRARHDYTIEDTFEAGLVLTGTEVKSLRLGRASLVDGYAFVDGGEAWLDAVHIPEYADGTWNNHAPRRKRKLLLHKAQILKIEQQGQAGRLHDRPAVDLLQRRAARRSRSRWRRASASTTSARRSASGRTTARRSAPCPPSVTWGSERLGSMDSTAQRIPIEGTYNFRDVGGYATDGGVVRSGKLFRADALGRLGAAGRESLRELGIRIVIDLRDDFEVQALPDDLEGLDVEVLHLPVFEGSGASASTVGATIVHLYDKIVFQHTDVIVRALREIADTGDEPVVVHCTAGKDRTGIVIALALLAVGVDRETVVADYALTEANLDGPWLEGMLELVRGYGVDVTPDLRVILGGSPREALETTIDRIEERSGSVRQYLLAAGLDELELAKLRSVLVEPA